MNLTSWGYSLRQAFKSLTSSGLMSLASVATVAISLLVLSSILLLAVNLELWAGSVESQVEVRAFLAEGLTESDKQALVAQVQALPAVGHATYVSKEQGLESFKQQLGDQKDILLGLDEMNPLPDTIEVKLSQPDRVQDVVAAIQPLKGVDKVSYGQGTVERLLAFTHALRLGGAGLVVLLLVATVLTISNTIRLAVFAKRREVAIMKLVGATDWFIRRPFVVEGISLGAFGAGMAMLITSFGYRWLALAMVQNIPFLPVSNPDQVLPTLTVVLLLLGGALGATGSFISLRRFLKV